MNTDLQSVVERLNQEGDELTTRLEKLLKFMSSADWDGLSAAHKILLTEQKKVMYQYLDILVVRLALLTEGR